MEARSTILLACLLTALLSGCASPGDPYVEWKSLDAIQAFNAAGLEAQDPRAMTNEDYGAAPRTAEEGTRFFIPSLCGQDESCESGGRAFSYASEEDKDAMKAYYEDLGRQNAWFHSWVYEHDNLLVQINGDLPEEKAEQYRVALKGLG